jgi:Secretion system C-terminal sorting domain
MNAILHSVLFIGLMRRHIMLVILLLMMVGVSWGQVSLTTASSSNSQNFDGMTTGTNLPSNWRIHQSASPTWSAGSATLLTQASSGNPTAGASYNWGTTGGTDRSAGVMTSGSYSSPNSLMAFYTNGDANSISEISISYSAERYRTNTASASVQFFYSTDGSTWTSLPAADISSSSFPTGSSSYNFSSPLIVNVTASATLTIVSGGNFYLRWNINTTGSNSQAIGIDNVVISATFTVANSYRSLSAGTWGTTATWQRFTAGAWNASTAPAISNTTDNIYIRHAISSGGSISAGKLIVESGGTLTYTAASTCATSMIIKNGGILQINAALNMTSSTFTVESGGRVNLNNGTTNGVSTLWAGAENFQSGSVFEIQNWDYGAGGGDNRLVQNLSIITLNTTGGYYFGNLIISGNPTGLFVMSEGSQSINLCENNFTVSTTGGSGVAFTNAGSNVTIGGNLIVTNNQFNFAVTTTANAVVSTVLGNIIPTGGIINLNQGSAAAATSTVQLKGNLNIPAAATLSSTDDGCKIVFSGTGTQTISIAGTLNTRVDFEVASGATTQLINQNLNLAFALNDFTVLAGGTHEFNGFDIIGSGGFDLQAIGTIKITSVDGVNASPSAVGNVRNTGTRTFSQTGYYHYVGSATPQSTGTAMTSGSTAKRIIIEKTNATDVVNLTQSTGVATSGSGYLSIIQGIFNESTTSVITGSGDLLMSGGEYRMPLLSTTLPQLTGAYSLPDGTIVLNGAGNQLLRGARDYNNLTFNTSGTKTLSSSPNSVNGTITVANAAILNVAGNTMGGSGTNLTMTGTSQYITNGTGTKPDAQGTYSLGSGTTIEFANTNSSEQQIRLSPSYYNIIVSGINVANASVSSTPINMQTGSTFSVTNGGVFRHYNANGFAGGASTAISNTNNPTIDLQTNSTIDYARTTAGVFSARTDYKNIIISGGGTKTLNGPATMSGILTLTSGLVTTTSTNLLTLDATATCPALGSSASFINGPLRKLGTAGSSFTFPVGKLVITTPHYREIGISNLAALSDFTAEFFRANPYTAVGSTITAPGLQRVSFCEYWNLNRASGAEASVTLSWGTQSPCNNAYVTELATLVVAHYGTTSWDSYGGEGNVNVGSTLTAGSITWNDVATFSPFALGSTSLAENPLPFNLNSFNAIAKQNAIQLDWTVGNNHLQEKYILERSSDGLTFETITIVAAKQNFTLADYSFDDLKPRTGWNYYRLRARDIENKTASSRTIKVWWGKGEGLSIFPNPASEKIVINLSDPSSITEIQIVNAMGQVLRHVKTIHFNNEVNISSLQAGIYYIRFHGNNGFTTRSFVKQ